MEIMKKGVNGSVNAERSGSSFHAGALERGKTHQKKPGHFILIVNRQSKIVNKKL